jgi:hypothetical protein
MREGRGNSTHPSIAPISSPSGGRERTKVRVGDDDSPHPPLSPEGRRLLCSVHRAFASHHSCLAPTSSPSNGGRGMR